MLDGGGGRDGLDAAEGDDTLDGGDGADILDGGADHDLLIGAKGADMLTGGAGNDRLFGGFLDDTLFGDTGRDWLAGGLGADRLAGGAQADTFVFARARGGIDVIEDFATGVDRIALEGSHFRGLATGALDASAFQFGAVATEADDRILYDAATGALFFDIDGSGERAAVQFASLTDHPAISAADFMVI